MDDSVSMETTSRSSSSSSTEALTEFSIFIDKLTPLISRMKEVAEATGLPAIQKAIDSLETDYFRAKAAAESQTPKNFIEFLVQSFGRSMGLVFFASHEAPMRNKLDVKELCKEMIDAMVMLSRFIVTDGDVFEAEEEDERTRNSSEEYGAASAKNESKSLSQVNLSPPRSVPAAPRKICCIPFPRSADLLTKMLPRR